MYNAKVKDLLWIILVGVCGGIFTFVSCTEKVSARHEPEWIENLPAVECNQDWEAVSAARIDYSAQAFSSYFRGGDYVEAQKTVKEMYFLATRDLVCATSPEEGGLVIRILHETWLAVVTMERYGFVAETNAHIERAFKAGNVLQSTHNWEL